MNTLHSISILLIVMLGLGSCGRKKKDIFLFPTESTRKIKRLSLPAVRGVSVENIAQGIKISWLSIDNSRLDRDIKLLGYYVYRMTPDGFIPRNRFLQHSVQNNYFIVSSLDVSRSYGIRGLFKYYDQKITGPLTIISTCMGK